MGFISDLLKKKSVPANDAAATEELFEKIKAKRGADTAKWLNLMVDPSKIPAPAPAPTMEDLEEVEKSDVQTYVPPLETMVAGADDATDNPAVVWVNGLFDEFARLAQQFNSDLTDDQLRVSIRRPTFDANRHFVGSIATKHWGLLLQGMPGTLYAYIAPGDESMSWTESDITLKNIAPFMTIQRQDQAGTPHWYLAGIEVCPQCAPFLAKELFGDLIRVATGKMSDAELLTEESRLVLGQTVAQGYKS